MENNYCFLDLSNNELFDIDGGGTGLAIICGLLTVVATVSVAAATPGGFFIKAKVASKVAVEGFFLTAGAYEL